MPTATEAEPYSPAWLNALSNEEKKALGQSKFMLDMYNDGCAHVLWLLWSVQRRQRWATRDWRQGSLFFLDCGRGPFAVTAGHVYEQFLCDCRSRRVRSCQFGDLGFNPEERLIAWGKNLGIDVATFRVTAEEVAATGKKVIFGTDGPWPAPPNTGENVFFGGFPGRERYLVAHGEFEFGVHSGMNPLTDFTDYQLRCRFDRRYWVDVRGLGLPPVGYDLGGTSGGPLMQPIYENGVWGWRLIGVISEAIMQQDFETITAVRAHFILPHGGLSR